jgi:hypothetical protein
MSAPAAAAAPESPKRAAQAAAAPGGDGSAGHGGSYQSTPGILEGALRRDPQTGELLPPGQRLVMLALSFEHRVALVITTMDLVIEELCYRAFIRGEAAALAALHTYLGAPPTASEQPMR